MRPYGEEYTKSTCSVHGHGTSCIVSEESDIRNHRNKHIKHRARFKAKMELDRLVEDAIIGPIETDLTQEQKETKMDLDTLILKLQELQKQGYGKCEVFTTNGASGACDPIGNPNVREVTGNEDQGPFDLAVGTPYIDIYNGN